MPPLGRSFRLALPLILSNLTVPLMGMVDTAVVGRIPGAHNLAAVALGAAVMNLVVWGFGFLRTATGGLAAQAFGAGDARTLKAILLRSGLVAVAATAFVFLLAPFAFPASAALFAAEGELRATLHAYLVVRILGTPFILGGQVLTGWFLGRQETGVPLLVMLTANLLNAALDVVLVLGLGYGVAGAAAATVAGYSSAGRASFIQAMAASDSFCIRTEEFSRTKEATPASSSFKAAACSRSSSIPAVGRLDRMTSLERAGRISA